MKAKRVISQAYLWLVLAVLYAPIIFIAVFSFTEAKSLGNWTGFTLDLYKSLFYFFHWNGREGFFDANPLHPLPPPQMLF